jgi:hypothetical protein
MRPWGALVRDMRTRLRWERVSDQRSRSVAGAALFLTLAARGGHAVPAGALRAAPHAIAATRVWLAAVFAVAGERKSLREFREAVSDRVRAVRSRGERPPARGAPKHRR